MTTNDLHDALAEIEKLLEGHVIQDGPENTVVDTRDGRTYDKGSLQEINDLQAYRIRSIRPAIPNMTTSVYHCSDVYYEKQF